MCRYGQWNWIMPHYLSSTMTNNPLNSRSSPDDGHVIAHSFEEKNSLMEEMKSLLEKREDLNFLPQNINKTSIQISWNSYIEQLAGLQHIPSYLRRSITDQYETHGDEVTSMTAVTASELPPFLLRGHQNLDRPINNVEFRWNFDKNESELVWLNQDYDYEVYDDEDGFEELLNDVLEYEESVINVTLSTPSPDKDMLKRHNEDGSPKNLFYDDDDDESVTYNDGLEIYDIAE